MLPLIKDVIELKVKLQKLQISEKQFWRKYKKLHREFQFSEEWKIVRKEVRERDVVCQKCGMDHGRLDVHHIIFFFNRPELALTPTNLVLLCVKCHKALHKTHKGNGRLSKASKTGRNRKTEANRVHQQRVGPSSWRAHRLFK